ncbi:unnamed protein product [Closterium sp. NIES-54]
MHNGASRANRLHVFASVRTAVFYGATLYCSVGTPSTCCVGRSPFCSAGVTPLCNTGRRSTMLCCQSTRLAAELLVRANPRSLAHYRCRVILRMVRPTAAIFTMVDLVANASVADTMEARLANARKRHVDGEFGTIPLLIVKLGIRSQWATEHPSRPVSPRAMRNEGGVDDGARVSGNNGTKQREVIKVDGGIDRSQARVQQSTATTGSSRADVDGRRRSPLRNGGGLSAMTHVTAGGIAPTYGYFKFSPDRITVAPLQVATELDITPLTRADPPCISCVGGKLARHTFPTKGSDAEEALADVHIDLCGPFRVVAKDGSLYFLLLKDRHTRFLWVMLVAKKSDVLREFQKWLVLVKRQAKKSVLMLRSDRGGEFLGKEFTDFVDSKGIVHNLTCPYTLQQNGIAEREMRTAVESVRNCLERSTTPPGTTPYQMLTGKKPDLLLAWVWGCMVQFMVPEQQCGGKLAPKARWGLHLGVSPESKGWEVLDLINNKVVTSVEVIFYETLSLEVWKAKFGPASGRMQAHPPMDTSMASVPLLTEVDEPADEDVVEVLLPPVVLAPPFPGADWPALTPVSANGDEGSLEVSPVAPASGFAGGRQGAKLTDQNGKPSTTGEQQTGEPVEQEAAAGVQSTGELPKSAGGELSTREESTDSDVVEVLIMKPELRRTGRARRPPEWLSFHACLPPAAFTAEYNEVIGDLLYDDAKEIEELPELDPDMHAEPEHRWDIATMTVKEALASWKGEAVKAAMEEEIRNFVVMGTWELVERPRGVNIMKNRWVLMTKYRLDDTFECEKARLVVKGFTQVCGADYDETYSLLLKSLYGLRQSPLLWYKALDSVLLGAGWKKSQVDEALYFKASDNGVTYWVLVYVDNLLAASSSLAMLKELKELLEDAFKLREISPVVKYLGLEIVRDRPARKLWLHQQGYADKLRMRFIDEEQGSRVPNTPVSVDAYAELTFDDEEALSELLEVQQGVCEKGGETVRGRLGGGSRCVASSASSPEATISGSPASLLRQSPVGPLLLPLRVSRGASYSSSPEATISGAAVSWSSSRINCATLSSTESEYVAATNAGKEGRRLCFLLAEFKLLDAGKLTILRVDNKSAIMVAAGLGQMGKLKHMERRYAWLQHMVRRGKFVLKFIPTTEQPADFLTKALNFPAFSRCSVAIGQVCLANVGDDDDDVQQ